MNILILDSDELVWQGIGHFKQVSENWNFFDLASMKIHQYDFDKMDLVIVDTMDPKNHDIYLNILKNNPKKRIIVLSESLKSCSSVDCNYCVENNQIRRLMKPVDLQTLYKLIYSFENECDFFDSFDDICNLINSLLTRFSSLIYDETTKEVVVNLKSPSNIYTQELLSFVNILEQNGVSYSILDESKIRIN